MMKARILGRTEGVIMNSINSMCASSIFRMLCVSKLMKSIRRNANAPSTGGSYRPQATNVVWLMREDSQVGGRDVVALFSPWCLHISLRTFRGLQLLRGYVPEHS